jgi:glucose-6-phosphate 1-dehydrogenase
MSKQDADALVVFGITGDLAKKMTLRSLYRLEGRGLRDCLVIGVAVQDWSVERLRQHAHASIAAAGENIDEDVFARLAARLGYVSGDFADENTYGRVADALGNAKNPTISRSRRRCSRR